MAATEKFKQDILLKEEAFLIEVKAKLTDQLNRLKVEEVALVKLLSSNTETIQGQKTRNLFSRENKDLQESRTSQICDDFDAEDNLNEIPLEGLHSRQGQQTLNDYEEEDDEDEVDGESSYQQHLNAIMLNSQFQDNEHLDNQVSRSVVQCILQEEIEDFEDDDG